MHEIITLQLGQRANYLATHFWNLQESYFTYAEAEETPIDHDVHFRPGIGADGSETYTPRTLIYDLKGAFGSLRKHNALYELSTDADPGQGLWDGKEVIQRQTPIIPSEYQKHLEQGLPAPVLSSDTVRYWSDYNRLFYHPRSIVQLNDYELNSNIMPFEDWNVGEDLFGELDKEHDLLDRDLRPFAEECDQLRALQLFTSSDDAWGGFAAKYVDRLRDEFGKKAVWVWAIEGGNKVQRHNQLKRDMNKARSVHSISPQSSLYVPILDPPTRLPKTIRLDAQSEWQTSALISSAMETATLPTRLRSYTDFETSLAGEDGSHKIFELQSKILAEDMSNHTRPLQNPEDRGHKHRKGNLRNGDSHIFNQVQVGRGYSPEKEVRESREDLGLKRKERFYTSQPMLESFYIPLAYPILDSSPRNIFSVEHRDAKINVLAALTASSRTATKLKAMEAVAGRVIGVDERENLVNGLGEIRESYEIGWMSDSDFDDD
ncbi:misato family protein [Aspergillus novofumigatus IBT 16806]|uniref:Protein DML1 n=1 Tax=Aspergillus novofumigatus (strain IBT 16806) TaxID=1392255 RepID=A0A2I1C864_ASPN1|nr:tubulin nucleotide-binding domain-like protein [Aspergillus novofumigatus IBT 16806]PKX93822.1 tubulin nucleotide-binding domain-like protein [Aspergillus novofumigatus IBT 16806]